MDAQLRNLRMCTICDKGFSSGKSLGGHMRIHARDSSNEGRSKLINGGGTPVCSVYRKGFHSWKSLYGHMRSHPERPWRGIMEPPSAGWAMTGKWGRRRVSPEMPLDVMEAAEILSGIGRESGLVVGDSGEETGMNDVVQGLGSDPKKGKREDPNGDPDSGSGSGSGFGSGRFKCLTCKKAFASRMVLGRHPWSGQSSVRDPSSVAGNGSTREVGGGELGGTVSAVVGGTHIAPWRLVGDGPGQWD